MRKTFINGANPDLRKRRSFFTIKQNIKTSFNIGQIIPLQLVEVLPGDTHNVNMASVLRISNPFIKPIMDNLFFDVFHFFIPNRLVFEHWQELMGENKNDEWAQDPNEFTIPQAYATKSGTSDPIVVNVGTLADYFGLPPNNKKDDGTVVPLPSISALPFRAYALVYNEWFRNQAVQKPIKILKTDTSEYINNEPFSPANYMGLPAIANKVPDFFNRALPATQKGDPVNIAIAGNAPVYADKENIPFSELYNNGIQFGEASGSSSWDIPTANHFATFDKGALSPAQTGDPGASFSPYAPINLKADLSQNLGIPVNDLRLALQLQRMLERDARGGTRYVEIIENHFGVISPDARQQRPELLGAGRMPITTTQVAQTSLGLESNTQLADVAAFSHNVGQNAGYYKAFTEHGLILTVGVVRQLHTYQQAIPAYLLRKKRTDFFDPVFNNLGEQPIFQPEIFNGEGAVETDIFGYRPYGDAYRYKNNMITGQMRSNSEPSFDIWHLGDYYKTPPVINSEFVQETKENLDRVLTVESKVANQFLADILFVNNSIRVMSTYSVPGIYNN